MPKNVEAIAQFKEMQRAIEAQEGYVPSDAFGIAICHTNAAGTILDAWFPVPNYRNNAGTAALLASVTGYLNTPSSYELGDQQLRDIYSAFLAFDGDGDDHPNIDLVNGLVFADFVDRRTKILAVFIDGKEKPRSVEDAYLRLHLLSRRLAEPHRLNLDGVFGLLPNNVWTNEGPIDYNDLPKRQLSARIAGRPLHVYSMDRFPQMANYALPSGVRIANASNVRLGAHIGNLTVVMHAGSVNYNAGTANARDFGDGKGLVGCMIEGRISAGVFVAAGSDIGGGASTMGTLSGGGKHVITIGEKTLLGALSGTGISLGDNCRVEAGLYITTQTPVEHFEMGIVKALELSGQSDLLFYRHGLTGTVMVVKNKKSVELNPDLHKSE